MQKNINAANKAKGQVKTSGPSTYGRPNVSSSKNMVPVTANKQEMVEVEVRENGLVVANDKKKKKDDVPLTPKERKRKKRWRGFIVSSVVCSISLGVGVFLGYMAFEMFGPKGPTVNYSGIFEGYDYQGCSQYNSMSDILKLTGDEYTAKSQAVIAANTAFYKISQPKYFLTYEKQVVTAKVGITTNQNIEAITYASPDVTFNQNISSSSFVQTADRFYDYNDGTVSSYRGKVPSDWESQENVGYTYDELLTERGKLLKRMYYLDVDFDSESRTYKTDDYSEAGDNPYQEQAVVGYDISENTVTNGYIETSGSNYVVTLTMDYTTPTGYKSMGLQMQMTGGLQGLPNFSTILIQLTMDANLNLIKTYSTAVYTALTSGINAQCSSESTVYYFTQDTPFVNDAGETLKEPEHNGETGTDEASETKLINYSRKLSKEVA